ncbi:hypothetical protein RHSIM_Rhsim01G0079500 [Rhododendron simsii]|uniref:Uncharacterized protein n=1 Tax=Rhododendron simsii TaxID=118357 RepID=A0A834LY11_RHOSS|nr:hypothetical protein RHSIM_Rhsim01G0079500 [Rhododendron simsii]
MHELLYDAFGIPPFVPPTNDTVGSSSKYGPDEKTKKFFSLLKEAERELYPGCSKFSTLSFIVRLLHIKTLSGWTDKSFTMLLELLKEAFPEGDTLPKSFYATRVLLKDLVSITTSDSNNLPLWLCMKQPYMFLTLLIHGPHGLGDKIDTYLRLVVDELKLLWEIGVDTYDAESNQMFWIHALFQWTTNDFPALAMLSGWSIKGALACPPCNVQTRHRYLRNRQKMCYMGHRRWLSMDHRFQKNAASFDGTVEYDSFPT